MMSSKEITLKSAKEILVFFEAHPELSFDQMNRIVKAYAGDQMPVVVFTPFDKSKEDPDRPKREFLEWLEANLEALDNGEMPYRFYSTFRKK